MKTQLNKGQLLLTLSCLFGLTNAAGAAESVKEMEVVAAATRTSASLSAAPAAVTVINTRNIETKNAPRPGDMLDQAPSLYLRGDTLGHDGSI
ncbi:MAG: hypothetical protein WAW87_06700 [Candidatus Ferrigenium altingense]|jgi:outer membrane cobalamin receptor